VKKKSIPETCAKVITTSGMTQDDQSVRECGNLEARNVKQKIAISSQLKDGTTENRATFIRNVFVMNITLWLVDSEPTTK